MLVVLVVVTRLIGRLRRGSQGMRQASHGTWRFVNGAQPASQPDTLRQTGRQIDRQTDRQTDTHTHTHTDANVLADTDGHTN